MQLAEENRASTLTSGQYSDTKSSSSEHTKSSSKHTSEPSKKLEASTYENTRSISEPSANTTKPYTQAPKEGGHHTKLLEDQERNGLRESDNNNKKKNSPEQQEQEAQDDDPLEEDEEEEQEEDGHIQEDPSQISNGGTAKEDFEKIIEDHQSQRLLNIAAIATNRRSFQIKFVSNADEATTDDNENWKPIYRTREYAYHPVTMQQSLLYEQKRARFTDLNRISRLDTKKYPYSSEMGITFREWLNIGKESQKAAQQMYEFGAKIYLRMSAEDFRNCDLDSVSKAVDACNYISQFTPQVRKNRNLSSSYMQ